MPLADTIEFDATVPEDLAATLTETLLHDHRGKPDQRPMYENIPGWKRATKYRQGGFGRSHTFRIFIEESDEATCRAVHEAWQDLIGCTGTVTRTRASVDTEWANMTLDDVEELPAVVLEYAEIDLTFSEA